MLPTTPTPEAPVLLPFPLSHGGTHRSRDAPPESPVGGFANVKSSKGSRAPTGKDRNLLGLFHARIHTHICMYISLSCANSHPSNDGIYFNPTPRKTGNRERTDQRKRREQCQTAPADVERHETNPQRKSRRRDAPVPGRKQQQVQCGCSRTVSSVSYRQPAWLKRGQTDPLRI